MKWIKYNQTSTPNCQCMALIGDKTVDKIEIQQSGVYVIYASVGIDWAWIDPGSGNYETNTYAYTGFQLKHVSIINETLAETKMPVNMTNVITKNNKVKMQLTLYTSRLVKLQAGNRLAVMTTTDAEILTTKHETFFGVFGLMLSNKKQLPKCRQKT